jgi:hypothetical protein
MYVEEVCIDGFKSYAQRTVVPAFDPLFNAITGLNGSGKSNILDSICFVLGITNLSQVRYAARGARDASRDAASAPMRRVPTRERFFVPPRPCREISRSSPSFFTPIVRMTRINPRVSRPALTSDTPVMTGPRGIAAGAGVQARPGGRHQGVRLNHLQQRR